MIDGGGPCEYKQPRPLATDLPISNMQFPTDPPRSTICYGDGVFKEYINSARLIDPLLESDTFFFTAAAVRNLRSIAKRVDYDRNKTQILLPA